jgi:hypothetical protein
LKLYTASATGFGKYMAALGPGLPLGGEFFDALALPGSQIVQLGAVLGQIVKLPRARRAAAD